MFKDRTNQIATSPRSNKRTFGLAVMASLIALSCLTPVQNASAAPNGQTPYAGYLAGLGTTQLGAGDKFLPEIIMPNSRNVSFSWHTTVQNTAGGKWSVTDKSTGPALASGFTDGIGAFKIDFSKIAPADPPEKSVMKVYYVRVAPVSANHQGLAMPSNVVKIVYYKI